MANIYGWNVASGYWANAGNWKAIPATATGYPGQSGTTDVVSIPGNGSAADPIVITYAFDPSGPYVPLSATIGWLSLSGTYDTLAMSADNSTLTLDIGQTYYYNLAYPLNAHTY
jgi:hypothetical protein